MNRSSPSRRFAVAAAAAVMTASMSAIAADAVPEEWYRRTPFWDEQVGLLPFFRVVTSVSLALEPRPGD